MQSSKKMFKCMERLKSEPILLGHIQSPYSKSFYVIVSLSPENTTGILLTVLDVISGVQFDWKHDSKCSSNERKGFESTKKYLESNKNI